MHFLQQNGKRDALYEVPNTLRFDRRVFAAAELYGGVFTRKDYASKNSYSQICALQRPGPAAVSVTLGAEGLGVAALAVDVAVGRVVAEHGVQRAGAVAAGEAFLKYHILDVPPFSFLRPFSPCGTTFPWRTSARRGRRSLRTSGTPVRAPPRSPSCRSPSPSPARSGCCDRSIESHYRRANS